jgi:cyanophycinase
MRPSTPLAVALALALGANGCASDAPGGGAGGQGAATSAATGTATSVTTAATGGGGAGGAPVDPPDPPEGLVRYVTGDEADADVAPGGPGLILMGGGADVDEAFVWWSGLVAGGDVVVLRTSGEDGYNDYLYTTIGGVDSVETLLVTSRELANDTYVADRVRRAEGLFIAGGDQATYLEAWKDTAVEGAIQEAYARGAVVGGTSAGCAVLGEIVFAAENDTVYSDEALADPYNDYMTMDRGFLAFPPLARVVTDTHFAQRDRMGRLVAFVARAVADGWADEALGIGVDEATALLVDASGEGHVVGAGRVYLVRSHGSPAVCQAGQPLEYTGLTYHALAAGDLIALPTGDTDAPGMSLAASGGALSPADPY